MARDEDLLVVERVRGHELVLHLEALPRQRKDCHDMRLGMALVAFVLLVVVRGIQGAKSTWSGEVDDAVLATGARTGRRRA